jgi:hypothetical protein
MNRADLVSILVNSVAIVTFTKVDGSTRIMKCTLQEDFLPALKGSNHKRSQEVLPVWDIEAKSNTDQTRSGSWRSFRLDSIQSIEIVN